MLIIRRIEPELVQPAQASPGDAAVDSDRRTLESPRERRERRGKPRARGPAKQGDTTSTPASVYTAEGHVDETNERPASHTIDFTA